MIKSLIKTNFGLDLSSSQMDKFQKYLTNLTTWNKKFNLTSITDENKIWNLHFADSLACSLFFKNKSIHNTISVIDWGSGAGFPGIPLKIVYPRIKLVLVESTRKKCLFLDYIKKILSLENTQVIWSRAETCGQDTRYRASFDLSITRAVTDLPAFLEISLPLVKVKGHVVIWKSVVSSDELNSVKKILPILGGELTDVIEYNLLDSKRQLVVFQKTSDTPEKFPRPRNWGKLLAVSI